VTDEPVKGKLFSENDWNSKSSLVRNPYYFSKTLAEREAWKFVEAQPQEKRINLVVVNVLLPLILSPPPTLLNASISCFRLPTFTARHGHRPRPHQGPGSQRVLLLL